MLLRSLLNQSQCSMIMDSRRKDHLKRTARAGRDKEIGRKPGEKPIRRKGYLHCLSSTYPGTLVSTLNRVYKYRVFFFIRNSMRLAVGKFDL